jgi:iron complex outermembrane receptor protein
MTVAALATAATALVATTVHGEDLSGLESLLFEEIPSVFTASKTDQSIERATAVVTVITEEDIRTSGARTLYEVLKRVPGFFPSSQATWTLTASRGLTSDGNDHVLLLVDGHVQNSIVGQGYQQQDMLPLLQKVEKIEIIRGPGSVLWGSSAVMGIINVITKDGHEATDNVSTSFGSRDGMFNTNLTRSLGTDEAGPTGVVSLSFWRSDGFDRPGRTGSGASFDAAGADDVKSNVEFPWGRVGDWPSLDQHKDGWEIYSRITLGEGHEVLARLVESRVVYPWDTWQENPGSELRMRKTYLSYRNTHTLNDRVTVASTVYGDMLLQNRFPTYTELFKAGDGENRDHMQDQSNEERAFGVEVTSHVEVSETNRAIVGVKGVHAMIGPNRDSRFNIADNTPASTDYPYIGVESGPDNTVAAYLEDIWDVNDRRTTLFGGARIEHNDFRELKTVILPRAGVIHSVSDRLTAKYVFNTGYLRPNAVYAKTTGIIVDSTRGPSQEILLVDRSERIRNHEVQVYWKRGTTHVGVNVFNMSVDNYISFDASNVPQGYKNLGTAHSRGVEVEGGGRIGTHLRLHGNYSFVHAELDDGTHRGAITDDHDRTLNYPRHIVNLGLTWMGTSGRSLNVNANAWMDMSVVKPLNKAGTGGQFGSLPGEAYFDVSYLVPRFLGSAFDLSVFCMNALDNTDAVGMIVNNGYWYPRGRNVGSSLAYRW